jgi:hypothetical protein
MKKLIGLAMTAVALGAVGCSTTNAEKQYAADSPPPLASNSRSDKNYPAVADPLASNSRGDKGGPTVIDPVRLPRAKTQVSADDIDDTNVMDAVRKLEGEMNAEKRASARAGR